MEIMEFLRARLDEDEELALDAGSDHWELDGPYLDMNRNLAPTRLGALRHMARHDPARVLREIEATRRIVDGIAPADPHAAYITAMFTAWDVLRLLAQPYSEHPDYDPGWKP